MWCCIGNRDIQTSQTTRMSVHKNLILTMLGMALIRQKCLSINRHKTKICDNLRYQFSKCLKTSWDKCPFIMKYHTRVSHNDNFIRPMRVFVKQIICARTVDRQEISDKNVWWLYNIKQQCLMTMWHQTKISDDKQHQAIDIDDSSILKKNVWRECNIRQKYLMTTQY